MFSVYEISALSDKMCFLQMKLFHDLPNAFFVYAENFTTCPTRFLLIRKLSRSPQRIFGSCKNFNTLPSGISPCSKILMLCPMCFLVVRKFLFAVQTVSALKNVVFYNPCGNLNLRRLFFLVSSCGKIISWQKKKLKIRLYIFLIPTA